MDDRTAHGKHCCCGELHQDIETYEHRAVALLPDGPRVSIGPEIVARFSIT